MKLFLKSLLFSAICIFCQLNADWRVTCKDGSIVTLSICKGNLDKEREVFNKSFARAYQGTEIERMVCAKFGSLKKFLVAAFEDEQTDFDSKKENAIFISATNQAGQVVGFVAFDKNTDHVYVRQLAIDPEFKRNKLGYFLTFSFLNVWSNYNFVKLMTRKLNSGAISFYKSLGFSTVEYTHGALDTNVYLGMERSLDREFVESMLGQYEQVN